ncbi:MAG: CopG family transcriptional regulator [Faecalispora jeddahensis]
MAAKKMGCPTDNPKDITMKIRFDQDSFEQMEKCSEEMKISRAEVVRRGVQKMYDDLKNQK